MNKLSLSIRLVLISLAMVWLGIGGAAILIHLTTEKTMADYILEPIMEGLVDRQVLSSLAAALGAGVISAVTGSVLVWQLTRTLRQLTAAVRDLRPGQLGKQIEERGAAELVELARAFNQMSRDLAEGEALRRRMAADVAHELRTPIGVLRGQLEAMLDGVFPLDQAHVAVAYDQMLHLSRLVEDLRLLTQAEAGQLPLNRVEAPLEELVKRAVEGFAPLALDAGICLVRDVLPGLPCLWVDVDRFRQIMGNLLSNALRHTPPGGTIMVRASPCGEVVRIAVSNTGAEPTPDQAAHVFDRFWRADEARQRDGGGSGLGLAITQQLVALHGGRIWVETAPGITTFSFELPIKTPGNAPL